MLSLIYKKEVVLSLGNKNKRSCTSILIRIKGVALSLVYKNKRSRAPNSQGNIVFTETETQQFFCVCCDRK